ncbi:MAG: L,D-transpeptidase family protein, partial [Acetobacteraceae bacterium]|nr:L,D-transpeptidase family protein [Acetobacteraceae bacterium]
MAENWMESRALGGVSRIALCAGLSLIFAASAAPAQAQFGWFGGGVDPAARTYEATRHYARVPATRRHAARHSAAKMAKAGKTAKEEPSKPIVGPLIISVSVNRQHLTVYDGDRPVASTVISTGVKGHETPFGVFNVLQKELLHHSNLYSNAPMPHMQRITWSGVALHAGVVTGRPASHGCIRLPPAFATRLYGMTKVGARVIVSRPEVAPTEFSSPRLFTMLETPPAATAAAPGGGSESATPAPGQGAALAPATGTPDNAAVRPRAAGQVASLDKLAIPRTVSDESASQPPQEAAEADLPSAYAEMAPTPEEIAAAAEKQQTQQAAETAPAAPSSSTQAALPPAPGGAVTASPAQPVAKPAAPAGPISIFLSRKEKKLFVRRNFKPIYEAPIAFEGDQPLGTHVFTATNAPADGTALHWVAMSVASANPGMTEPKRGQTTTQRDSRGRKVQAAVVPPPLPMASPAEALERVQIAPEVRAQIAAMITPGSSLVISDKGLGGETSPKAG